MDKQKVVMAVIVVVSLILYLVGMGVISAASLDATTKEGASNSVDKLWLDLVSGVTVVLALNAGAYLGLKQRRFRFDFSDPETARLIATIVYFLVIVAAFFIAVTAKYPHPALTDMAGTLIGFGAGVGSVFLGGD